MCFHRCLLWSWVLFNKNGSFNLEGVLIFSESTSIPNITNTVSESLRPWEVEELGKESGIVGQKAQFSGGCLWKLLSAPVHAGEAPCRSPILLNIHGLLRWALLTAMLEMSAPDGLVVTFSQNSWEALPTSLRNGKDYFLKCWLTEQNVLEWVTDFFLLPPFTCCKTTYGDLNLVKKQPMASLSDDTLGESRRAMAKESQRLRASLLGFPQCQLLSGGQQTKPRCCVAQHL